MRKLNAVLSMLILVLFILHAVFGSFQILGIGNTALKLLAWVSVCLIIVHTVIGIKLTWDTLRIQKKNGVSYFRENKLFWVRRISGFAVMLFIAAHIFVFMGNALGFIVSGFETEHFGLLRGFMLFSESIAWYVMLWVFLTIFFGPLTAVGYLIGMIVITFITGFINVTTPILSPNHSVMTQITIGAICFFGTILMIFIGVVA